MTTTQQTRRVDNENLALGDVVPMWTGRNQRIVRIEPYKGPLADIILAVMHFDVGLPCSLEIGGTTEIVSFT
jgi:hypothetical protein